MFKLYKVEDIVRIPPSMFGQDLARVAEAQLREKYESTYDDEIGYIIFIGSVDIESIGRVLSGDGASYHRVNFDLVSFKPIVNEIIEGEVIEIASFGVFVRVGPLDALLHISQIMDEFVSVDPSQGMVVGKESNKVLRVGDKVRVRVVAVSPPKGVSVGKVGLTCRQPYLGKLEWIDEEVAKKGGE